MTEQNSELVRAVYYDIYPMVKEVIEATMVAGIDDMDGGVMPVPSASYWSHRISRVSVDVAQADLAARLLATQPKYQRNVFYSAQGTISQALIDAGIESEATGE